MWNHILNFFVNRDLDERNQRVELTHRLIAILEDASIPVLNGPTHDQALRDARTAILENLARPETASFSEEVVKPFGDKGVVVSGLARSPNPQGEEIENRFIVAISNDRRVLHVEI